MKNYKRAIRRHQKSVKLIKRMKNWICVFSYDKREMDIIRQEILKGESCTFLRTTSRPCNCLMCTCEKYKRKQKQYILKEVLNEIKENMAP